MGRCRRKVPYKDFANAGPVNELGTCESNGYIYTPDGLYRIKKTRVKAIDIARKRIDVLLEIRKRTRRY